MHTVNDDSADDKDATLADLFTSPPTPPPAGPHFATFKRSTNTKTANTDLFARGGHGEKSSISIRLVGSHPLWGHYLWNAARSFAAFLERHSNQLYYRKNVLELGAGGGLPGIITALHGAKRVVLTDYPDQELLENLRINVKENIPSPSNHVDVQGYIWGRDTSELLPSPEKFDLILMSDLIFNHSQHDALLQTAEWCMAEPDVKPASGESKSDLSTPCVLVFYTHHRPHLANRDNAFFVKAAERGWACEKIITEEFEPMFPEDPGDAKVRATVHGWRLTRGKQPLP